MANTNVLLVLDVHSKRPEPRAKAWRYEELRKAAVIINGLYQTSPLLYRIENLRDMPWLTKLEDDSAFAPPSAVDNPKARLEAGEQAAVQYHCLSA